MVSARRSKRCDPYHSPIDRFHPQEYQPARGGVSCTKPRSLRHDEPRRTIVRPYGQIFMLTIHRIIAIPISCMPIATIIRICPFGSSSRTIA